MGINNYLVPILGNAIVATLTFYLGAKGYSYVWIGMWKLLFKI